jgi:hypothetical protein
MERIRIGWVALAVILAAGAAQAQDNKKKKAAEAAPAGPYGLPLLEQVKEKCKVTKEQEPKVAELYAAAAKNEEETKKRAKENQTERKDLEKYLAEGKSDAINKIKAVFDDEQKKTFDQMVSASAPKKK